MNRNLLILFLFTAVCLYTYQAKANPTMASKSQKLQMLHFIENKGQITNQHQVSRKDIDFKLSAGNGFHIFFGSGKIEYQWAKTTGQPSRQANLLNPMAAATADDITYEMYRMEVTLIGANRQAKIIREETQSFYERYYLPTVPEAGAIARSYRKITYQDIYPHIDWVFYFNNKGQLEHDFVVLRVKYPILKSAMVVPVFYSCRQMATCKPLSQWVVLRKMPLIVMMSRAG